MVRYRSRSGDLLKIPPRIGGTIGSIKDRALRFGGRPIAIELPEGLESRGTCILSEQV